MKFKKKRLIRIVVLAVIVAMAVSFIAFGKKTSVKIYNNADELKGKSIGVITATTAVDAALAYYGSDVKLVYYTNAPDMCVALRAGKIDAYILNSFTARTQCEANPDQKVLDTPLFTNPVGFFFTKNDAHADELCGKVNVMIAEFNACGKVKELEDKWSDGQKHTIDIHLTGENGTIRYACTSSIGKPFCYVQDNEIVGCEVEIISLFCEKYGYGLEIIDYDYNGMLAAVASGKADIGGICTMITEERQKQCMFSDPYRNVEMFAIVNCGNKAVSKTGFFKSIAESFHSNFILESRWKLILSGIGITLLITITSIILGSMLGLCVFFLCYDGKKEINRIVDFCMWLVHGMPVVVFLMILFYIIFGKSTWSGATISIIAFTVIFACACINMLRNSYSSIPYGQTEAAIALGYTRFQALWKRLMPQMILHLKSSYESEIVSLMKSTSVVGYIAVQDLTKASDIIRGCTYEAFFPLIATTVIYFILAALLKAVIKKLFGLFDNRKRSRRQILKGV